MPKKKILITISFIMVSMILIISILNYGQIIDWHFFRFNLGVVPQRVLTYQEEYSDIYINGNMDIEIKPTKSNAYKVAIYDIYPNEINVNTEDGVLNIINAELSSCYLCALHRKMVISVPKQKNINLHIVTIDKNIKVEKLPFINLNIQSTRGNINVSEANNVTIEAQKSPVTLGYVNHINVKSDNDIVIGSGVIDNISTNQGNITVTGLIYTAKLGVISTKSGNVDIKDARHIYIDYQTTSGKVQINELNLTSDDTLKITTDSGNIIATKK